MLYAGAIVAMGWGTLTFLAADSYTEPSPLLWRVRQAASALLVVAPALLLLLQLRALEMTATDLPLLLQETGWGRGWLQLATVCGGAAVTVLLAAGSTSSLLALMGALGVAVAMGGLGHAAADERWPLGSRLLDAMHVAGMGAWIGGLLVTWLETRGVGGELAETPATRARWGAFSRTATVMAPVTVLAGVGSSLRRFDGVGVVDIMASPYGRLLLLKTLLVAAVLALGWAHRRRVQAGHLPVAGGVRRELMAVVAVLLMTAVLTGISPPSPPELPGS